jgi:predicted metal-binding membrane protein
MNTGTMLERGLRRDRVLVITALVLAVILSWAYVLSGAGMSMQNMPGMLMPMPGEPWTVSYVGLVFLPFLSPRQASCKMGDELN